MNPRSLVRHIRRALMLLALTTGTAAAQATISGVVLDETSGLTMTGTLIRIPALDREVVSDRTGRFVINGIPAGRHTVTARYLGYVPVSHEVTVVDGATAQVEFRLSSAVTRLGEVVITESRSGQAAALAQQQNAATVSNIIAADQIGRFPDANIGDALKRVPGVTVALDQGEARFGSIRGTEPRFNTVMVNGERVPSAEAEVREVQLDLIPADMVQAIEVNKTLTPDMDADAIGGAVNVVTRAAPAGFRLNTTVGSGYNFIRDKPVLVGSAVAGNRFFDNRLGVIVSASYYDQRFGSDNKEGVWEQAADGSAFIEEFDVRRYDVQRTRRSLSGSFDLDLGANSSVMYRALYNHRDDWENRFRLRYVLDEPDASGVQNATLRRQTKGGGPDDRLKNTRLEDQRTQSHQLSGDHLLGGFAELTWSGSIARASETRPDERYIEWQVEDVGIQADYGDEQNPRYTPVNSTDVAPNAFGFRRIEVQESYTKDNDMNGRVDLRLPFRGARSSVKMGVRARDKDKLRNNSFDRAIPQNPGSFGAMTMSTTNDYSVGANLTGNYPYGIFSTPGFLAGLPVYDPSQFTLSDRPDEYAAGNFNATERIYAGYVQLEQELARNVSIIAGVRVENTRVDYHGFEHDLDTDAILPTQGDRNYTDVLPSVNLRWDVDDRTVVRAAWTNTLARPNYFDLVPYRELSFDDNELAMGNPDLGTTRSMNLDLMAERYFDNVGLISGGVFYKDISDFIFNFTEFGAVDPVTGQTFSRIRQPRNGASASLFGVEVAVQRQLDFLPGALRYLGVFANYTLNESSVSGLGIAGRDESGLPLLGTAKHSGNFSLSWDAPRAHARIAFNYQSESLDAGEGGYNESGFYDRWADKRMDIDLNAGFTLRQGLRYFIEVNNLNDRPLRFYQGQRGRLMQDEFYGRRIQTGVKFDF